MWETFHWAFIYLFIKGNNSLYVTTDVFTVHAADLLQSDGHVFWYSCCMTAMSEVFRFLSCSSWLIAGAYVSPYNAKTNKHTHYTHNPLGWLRLALGGSQRGAGVSPDTRLPLLQPKGQLLGHFPQGTQALLNTMLGGNRERERIFWRSPWEPQKPNPKCYARHIQLNPSRDSLIHLSLALSQPVSLFVSLSLTIPPSPFIGPSSWCQK